MELKVQTGYRQILSMALPISLAMLVPQINFIINNIFLGGLGEMELASAGITGVYYFKTINNLSLTRAGIFWMPVISLK